MVGSVGSQRSRQVQARATLAKQGQWRTAAAHEQGAHTQYLSALRLQGVDGKGLASECIPRNEGEQRRQLQLPRLLQLHAQVHAAAARPYSAPRHLQMGQAGTPAVCASTHIGVHPQQAFIGFPQVARHHRSECQMAVQACIALHRSTMLASMSCSNVSELPRSWIASTVAVTSSGGRVAASPSSLHSHTDCKKQVQGLNF
jgi:hypothetical protein